MLIFDIKENEQTYNRQLIILYQQIYIINVQRPNISLRTFLKTEFKYSLIDEVKRVSVHLRCSNIYDDKL